MTDMSARLEIFGELLSCIDNLSFWRYSGEMALQSSSSAAETLFDTLFSISGCKERALEHCRASAEPILLTDEIGMTWIAAAERDGETVRNIYVIGPVFTANATERSVSRMAQELQVSVSLKLDFLERVKSVPVVMISAFSRYGAMLYYCITGRRMGAYDLLSTEKSGFLSGTAEREDEAHGTWAAEQAMLRAVEEGDLSYRLLRPENQIHGRVGTMADTPLRQCKNEIIIWVSLCARAAIRGGVEVETALTASDYYIRSVEASATTAEAYRYSAEMFETFVRRVAQLRRSGYSRAVSACVDYVQANIREKIDLEEMAGKLGYTAYYLSTRFKREVGMSLKSYINRQRVELAKPELLGTDKSLAEISDELCFGSQSYFGTVFKRETGLSPSAFRERKGAPPDEKPR